MESMTWDLGQVGPMPGWQHLVDLGQVISLLQNSVSAPVRREVVMMIARPPGLLGGPAQIAQGKLMGMLFAAIVLTLSTYVWCQVSYSLGKL